MNIILKSIEDYCINHSIKDSELLTKLNQYTHETEAAPQMLCGRLIGGILQLLIQISKSKKVLEIGMFTGYSALKMAEVLPCDGKIDTCELYENHVMTAEKWFKKSIHGHKINIHKGDAVQTIEQFKIRSYDLLFVDADKSKYPEYFRKGFKLLKPGGIGVFDNMLWSGTVLEPNDEDSLSIDKTNKMIRNSTKLNQILLPIRDGVMIFQKDINE